MNIYKYINFIYINYFIIVYIKLIVIMIFLKFNLYYNYFDFI